MFFFVKDNLTRKGLLQGPLDQGLYKLLTSVGSFRNSTLEASAGPPTSS